MIELRKLSLGDVDSTIREVQLNQSTAVQASHHLIELTFRFIGIFVGLLDSSDTALIAEHHCCLQ